MKAEDLQIAAKIAAGCLFFAADTKNFLLLQRSEFVPSPGTWSLPGGRSEDNELPEDTARREIYEETGFDLEDQTLHLIYTNETHLPKFKFYTYASVIKRQFEPKLNYENTDFVWCTKDNMPSPLHWGLKQLFKHRKAMKRLKHITKTAE